MQREAQDRLITATTPAGQATYRYWPDGLLKGTSLPSGLEEARCYDPAGRVTAIVTARAPIADSYANPATMVSRFDYAYDGREPQLFSLAKKAAAFLEMSRCIRRVRTKTVVSQRCRSA